MTGVTNRAKGRVLRSTETGRDRLLPGLGPSARGGAQAQTRKASQGVRRAEDAQIRRDRLGPSTDSVG
jgi:hypothetical protein